MWVQHGPGGTAELTGNGADFEDGKLLADATSKSTAIYAGSCHCREVKWTVGLDNPQHTLCHCDTRKKLGGQPLSCNQILPKDELRIMKGSPRVYTYTSTCDRLIRWG